LPDAEDHELAGSERGKIDLAQQTPIVDVVPCHLERVRPARGRGTRRKMSEAVAYRENAGYRTVNMTEKSLRTLVAGLRSELTRAHDLDADAREALHSLAGEVEALLQTPPAGSQPAEPTLRERLADRVTELEASHPELSRTVGNIVDVLAFYNL
jgi:hypothetical protein